MRGRLFSWLAFQYPVTMSLPPSKLGDPEARRRDVSAAADAEPSFGGLYDSSGAMRVMKPRRAAPNDIVRPTRAEVNLEALRANAAELKRAAGQAQVWAVLKADGYGHGAPAVARTLERAKVDGFCVALLEEGIELREAGIQAPILVMGGYYGRAYEEVLQRRLIPVVYDDSHLEGFAQAVRAGGLPHPAAVHLKIDTGMARLGVRVNHAVAFAKKIAEYPELRVTGLMTHLACADAESPESLQQQMTAFDDVTAALGRVGVRTPMRHAANSAALLRQEARLDMVRPGVAIFGISPLPANVLLADGLQPAALTQVMRVRSEVVALREVEAGDPVGYGALFRPARKSRIATIAMGYADGLPRSLTNRGSVLVRGMRAPIVGAVSMDMTMIDVTDVPGVDLRDEAVVLGAQDGPLGKAVITAEEIAEAAGTITWEVLTHISRRVPRFYREP
jgi:alanine racemase